MNDSMYELLHILPFYTFVGWIFARHEDIGRMRRRHRASAAGRKVAVEEEYISTIDDLLPRDCVQQMQQYMQHGNTTTYTHCRAVAYYSVRLCRTFRLGADIKSVARGAMLHDLYLYDWHNTGEGHRLHGFYHPGTALANARQYFEINDTEANIIRTHMWPLTVTKMPRCREAVIVCLVDKACSLAETFGYRYRGSFSFEKA